MDVVCGGSDKRKGKWVQVWRYRLFEITSSIAGIWNRFQHSESLQALRVFGITSSIAGIWNHFQHCRCWYSESLPVLRVFGVQVFLPCMIRGRIPAGRSAVHPTATGWDELLLDRTAGVRLTIGSFSRETFTVCRR